MQQLSHHVSWINNDLAPGCTCVVCTYVQMWFLWYMRQTLLKYSIEQNY